MRLLGAVWVALACLIAGLARAADSEIPGSEVVVILDNSCSMIARLPSALTGQSVPAADPRRQAVLGALVVEGLTRDTADRLTVLAFGPRGGAPSRELRGYDQIRDLPDTRQTTYLAPLKRARQILEGSDRTDRLLVFLSDGAPTDYDDPAQGPRALGLDTGSNLFDTVVIGMLGPGAHGDAAERFLRPLARSDADWVRVHDGADMVATFTRAYAGSLGSKALTGTLAPGASHSFRVGRYVTEVMAIAASTEPMGPFEARLDGPAGSVPVKAAGDNGCTRRYAMAPNLCKPPRMHFKVWRTSHDPEKEATYTLAHERGRSDMVFGIILRYELVARVEAPPSARIGDDAGIRAHLEWRGQVFDDATFFGEDGFEARARFDGREVPLTPDADGQFPVPFRPDAERDTPVGMEIVFRNAWMDRRTRGSTRVEGYLPLNIVADPAVLDFGSWRGGRGAETRCLRVDLSGSKNLDQIGLQTSAVSIPQGVGFKFTPVDPRPGETPMLWEACVEAPGCCGHLASDPASAVRLVGDHPHYAATPVDLPVRFDVAATGFLRCWWPWLLGALLVLLVLLVLLGLLRPHDFEEDATIRVGSSDRQLQRAAALVLREQPKGRRGFYRNARCCITQSGEFVSAPRRSALWIEAVGRGETRFHSNAAFERRDRRTKKWLPVEADEARDGFRVGEIYRVGGALLVRFG